MIPPFQLHRPRTLDEAVGLLAELGDEARIHAGGTELVLVLREGLLEAAHLVDIKRVEGLAGVHLDAGGWLVIGAATTHTDLARSEVIRARLPVFAALESVIANPRVRNSGTIGGNLAFAEPHADPSSFLVAADAELRLVSAAGARTVPLAGWIGGPFEVDLGPGEILAEVRVPMPAHGRSFGGQRFKALERPSVTVAARLDVDDADRIVDARLVVGCLAGGPQRITAAEAPLYGLARATLDDALDDVAEAVMAGVDAATDAYGPADYKRHLSGVLARRALQQAGARE